MSDNWPAIFQDISICSGLIEDGDAILAEEAIGKRKACYQPGTFDTNLGHRPEVDVSQVGDTPGKIIVT